MRLCCFALRSPRHRCPPSLASRPLGCSARRRRGLCVSPQVRHMLAVARAYGHPRPVLRGGRSHGEQAPTHRGMPRQFLQGGRGRRPHATMERTPAAGLRLDEQVRPCRPARMLGLLRDVQGRLAWERDLKRTQNKLYICRTIMCACAARGRLINRARHRILPASAPPHCFLISRNSGTSGLSLSARHAKDLVTTSPLARMGTFTSSPSKPGSSRLCGMR